MEGEHGTSDVKFLIGRNAGKSAVIAAFIATHVATMAGLWFDGARLPKFDFNNLNGYLVLGLSYGFANPAINFVVGGVIHYTSGIIWGVIFALIFTSLIMPPVVLIIPDYVLAHDFHILNTFTVQIVNDSIAEDDENLKLILSNPTGGAVLGVSNALLTILDNDTPNGRLNFTAGAFSTNENAGAAIISVKRSGGSQGTLTVQAAATNGTVR